MRHPSFASGNSCGLGRESPSIFEEPSGSVKPVDIENARPSAANERLVVKGPLIARDGSIPLIDKCEVGPPRISEEPCGPCSSGAPGPRQFQPLEVARGRQPGARILAQPHSRPSGFREEAPMTRDREGASA